MVGVECVESQAAIVSLRGSIRNPYSSQVTRDHCQQPTIGGTLCQYWTRPIIGTKIRMWAHVGCDTANRCFKTFDSVQNNVESRHRILILRIICRIVGNIFSDIRSEINRFCKKKNYLHKTRL